MHYISIKFNWHDKHLPWRYSYLSMSTTFQGLYPNLWIFWHYALATPANTFLSGIYFLFFTIYFNVTRQYGQVKDKHDHHR